MSLKKFADKSVPASMASAPAFRCRSSVPELVSTNEGRTRSPGEVGTIYFKAPKEGPFHYFKDKAKTGAAYRGDFFTLGDLGYFDEDGYLFLSGRSAEVIISGGVNIYPAEVDAVLLAHPKVSDVATVGVPNKEWRREILASQAQYRPSA